MFGHMDAAELGVEVFNLTLVCASDERVTKPAVQAFTLSAQFALAMLKLPEEWRRWGESKGVGRERGERRDFFLPSPFPLSFFRPRTYRKGYYFYSPQSSTVIKSKMAATTMLRTRTRFRLPKIRLHCRLRVTCRRLPGLLPQPP